MCGIIELDIVEYTNSLLRVQAEFIGKPKTTEDEDGS